MHVRDGVARAKEESWAATCAPVSYEQAALYSRDPCPGGWTTVGWLLRFVLPAGTQSPVRTLGVAASGHKYGGLERKSSFPTGVEGQLEPGDPMGLQAPAGGRSYMPRRLVWFSD